MKNKYSIIAAVTITIALLCSATQGLAFNPGPAVDFAIPGSSTGTDIGPSTVTGSLGVNPDGDVGQISQSSSMDLAPANLSLLGLVLLGFIFNKN